MEAIAETTTESTPIWEAEIKKLRISTVIARDKFQARAKINHAIVEEYAELIENGVKLPPPIVYAVLDDWKTFYYLVDGFHRVKAATEAGKTFIPFEVRRGTERDALLFAATSNATHGLRRTNADKRRAVTMLLNDPEWSKESARWIAEKCGVSNDFVSRLKKELSSDDTCDGPAQVKGRDGKQYPATKPKAEPAPEPQAKVRSCMLCGTRFPEGECCPNADRHAEIEAAMVARLEGKEPPAEAPTTEWQCPDCLTYYAEPKDPCPDCGPEDEDEPDDSDEDGDEEDAFTPARALYRLETALEEELERWPSDIPKDRLVEWFAIKHGMMSSAGPDALYRTLSGIVDAVETGEIESYIGMLSQIVVKLRMRQAEAAR